MDAIRNGFTRYTAVEGIPDLKDAIIAKFKRDNGIEYTRPQILVSTGAKQTIYNLFMAVIDPGDEVIDPGAVLGLVPGHGAAGGRRAGHAVRRSRPGLQDHAGAARSGHHAEDARASCSTARQPDRCGLHARRTARRSAPCCAGIRDVIIATDDMYEHIYWAQEPFCSFLTACPDLYDRTVTINGVSKSYAMTGWRIGYCGGPATIIDGDVHDPEPEHLEPLVDRPAGGGRGAQRRPGRASPR